MVDLHCAGKPQAALEHFLSSHSADRVVACDPYNLTLMHLTLGLEVRAHGMADKVHLVPALPATVGHVNA